MERDPARVIRDQHVVAAQRFGQDAPGDGDIVCAFGHIDSAIGATIGRHAINDNVIGAPCNLDAVGRRSSDGLAYSDTPDNNVMGAVVAANVQSPILERDAWRRRSETIDGDKGPSHLDVIRKKNLSCYIKDDIAIAFGDRVPKTSRTEVA